MASNPSTFSPIGVDAMNSGYFMAGGGGGMMSAADVPHFHPSLLLDHGGFGFGLGDAAAATAPDMAANFAANNVMLGSFASHLFAAIAPAPPQDDHIAGRTPPEEMDEGYGVGSGAESCVAASLQRSGHSGGMAVWSSSSSKKPTGTWSSAAGSGAATVHEPYHLAGIIDIAGFHYAAAAAASSELSLTLCSKSSSSDSALTELPQAVYSRPANFAVVVARSSRYAAVAQEVLNDVVGHLLDGVADMAANDSCSFAGGGGARPSSGSSVLSSNRLMVTSSEDGGERRGEAQRVKNDLLKMLHLMDEKYNHCLDEIQSTTAKFNALLHSGGGDVSNGSSIYAPFAHRAVSAVYRGLRRQIAGEIMAAASRATATCWGGSSSSAITAAGGESWESAFVKKHWAARRRGEQQCWRPQRGLPEKSVAVLKAWLFENFLHPYPKDHEKEVLAARSGLTRNQVSNWFINARVRLWKPMIEEMYQDLKKSSSSVGGQRPAMEMHMNKR